MVPIYDDVVYLVDGLQRLALLDSQGIVGCVVDYLYKHPPHAPFIALTSVLGLLLSAGAPWGPYMLNAGWIAFLLLLGWLALRHSSAWTRVGIMVAVLAVPMFGSVLAEFRPDPVWGLLVGFAIIVSTSADLVSTRPIKLVGLGLLFGAAVISKPTAAPASALVLTVAWLVQVAVSLAVLRTWSIGQVFRASGWVALGAACMTIPYLLANGSAILAYVREVMGGESMWRTQASRMGHITYYLNRPTGTFALGWVWYAFAPLLAISAVVAVRLKDRKALPGLAAVVAALFTAYAIVTLSAVKSFMIGSILYGTIVAAVVWSMGYIATRLSLRGRAVVVLGLMVFLTQWVPRAGTIHRDDPAMLAADRANRAVMPALLEVLRSRPRAVVLVTVPGPAYAGTLDFLSRQQGVVRTFLSGYTADSWERVGEGVSSADVIVLSDVGMVGQSLSYSFPSLKFQARLLKELQTSSEFTGVSAYSDERQRSVWLFVRNNRR